MGVARGIQEPVEAIEEGGENREKFFVKKLKFAATDGAKEGSEEPKIIRRSFNGCRECQRARRGGGEEEMEINKTIGITYYI